MSHLNFEGTLIPNNIHIFILEDMKAIQDKILVDLKRLGFVGKVTCTFTVEEAIEKFKSSTAEFFISDWNLPDGIGTSFLEEVRKDKNFDNCPFLMLTTMDDVTNILSAMGLGADGYIVKPWGLEDLKKNMAFGYEKRAIQL